MRNSTALKTSAPKPFITQVAGTASVMLRGLSIRPYAPTVRQREREVAIVSGPRLPASRLYRERGNGNLPTIVIGGYSRRPEGRFFPYHRFPGQLLSLCKNLNSRATRTSILLQCAFIIRI